MWRRGLQCKFVMGAPLWSISGTRGRHCIFICCLQVAFQTNKAHTLHNTIASLSNSIPRSKPSPTTYIIVLRQWCSRPLLLISYVDIYIYIYIHLFCSGIHIPWFQKNLVIWSHNCIEYFYMCLEIWGSILYFVFWNMVYGYPI